MGDYIALDRHHFQTGNLRNVLDRHVLHPGINLPDCAGVYIIIYLPNVHLYPFILSPYKIYVVFTGVTF